CCNPCDWQPVPADLVLWQQLRAGWCAATASSICGQERQFPQNSAATISAAINELETLRIVVLFYPRLVRPGGACFSLPFGLGHREQQGLVLMISGKPGF